MRGGGGRRRQNASQDMRLFFSRRIGLSDDGEAIPILAGHAADRPAGRLFGRRPEHPAARAGGRAPATNFTALRLRRDILANSDIGAVF